MKNRELIEDSEELRAAVADLKEKASRAEGVSPDTLSLDSASASLDTASLDMIPEDVEQAANSPVNVPASMQGGNLYSITTQGTIGTEERLCGEKCGDIRVL